MGSRSNFRGLAMELWALTETSLTAPHNQTRMLVMSSPNIYGRGTSMNSALRSVGSIEFGAVAIGRNEGDRLVSCIQSLSHASTIIYVDSGSNDGSLEKARGLGADAIALDLSDPFTAGRARNAGFKRLQRVAPSLPLTGVDLGKPRPLVLTARLITTGFPTTWQTLIFCSTTMFRRSRLIWWATAWAAMWP